MFRTFISILSAKSRQYLPVHSIANNLKENVKKDFRPMFINSFSASTFNQNLVKVKPTFLTPMLNNSKPDFLKPTAISHDQIRTVIRYSWKNGTRKTVKAVIRRFYRLNWGMWIRTIAGRHRKAWRKSSKRKCKHRKHVTCNATQCRLLDKMVSGYWRKPKYYINSPYEPYEWREEFYITRRKPWRPEGCDYE